MIQRLIACSLVCLAAAGCDNKAKLPVSTVKKTLKISSLSETVSNTASFFNIYVTSNIDWSVEAIDNWLETDKTGGTGNASVRVSYEANTVDRRTGTIKFTAGDLKPVELTITQTELTFTNPIFQMPDPWVVKRGEHYYACKAQGAGINLSHSDKLSVINGTSSVWKAPADNVYKPWNVSNVWAPELHYIDGVWYIYYAAGRPISESNGSYSKQRTGVLRCKTDDPIKGIWEDMGMLYTGDNWTEGIKATADNTVYAIDMGVFKLNGQLYAIWSGNASATDGSQRLYIATMSNPYTITSSRVEISRADQSWEKLSGSVNEGPAFLHNEAAGKFFCVYSCNGSWTSNYRLGMLALDTSKDPMVKANWTKSAADVFYRFDNTANTVNGVNGVGHCCFTKSLDETEDWIVYHVNHSATSGWDMRQTFIQKFDWNADGFPDFGTPVGWGQKLPIPSGEME